MKYKLLQEIQLPSKERVAEFAEIMNDVEKTRKKLTVLEEIIKKNEDALIHFIWRDRNGEARSLYEINISNFKQFVWWDYDTFSGSEIKAKSRKIVEQFFDKTIPGWREKYSFVINCYGDVLNIRKRD